MNIIDKITEELFTSLIRRIEALEDRINGVNTKNPQKAQNRTPGMATEGQIKYIRALKGSLWDNMTLKEAGAEIDRCLKLRQEEQNNQTEIIGQIEDMYKEDSKDKKELMDSENNFL